MPGAVQVAGIALILLHTIVLVGGLIRKRPVTRYDMLSSATAVTLLFILF
jgi:hypothetical protein